MKPLNLQSELYQPTGSMTAEGISNQLGRPRLGRLALLVREAVQNSWDARLRGTEVIRFGLAGVTFSPEQRQWVASQIFAHQPPTLSITTELGVDERCHALIVYDRQTQGLSGPTRADLVLDEPESPNFVNFLRNVGHPPQRSLSGGTYGFGKTALYLASLARCLLVHTHTTQNRKPVSRFMAAALGPEYTAGEGASARRYTGRHWWGREQDDGIVEPLVDGESEEAASELRLPSFTNDETGTSIVLLAPDFEELTPPQAMRALGAAILNYCWPKMLDGPEGSASIEFELSLNGESISIPKPDQYAPIDGFARALRNLRARQRGANPPHDPAFIRSISSERPAKTLGHISITQFPPTARISLDQAAGAENPLEGLSRHVALLRAPGLVVRYLEGPPVPFDLREYAGVFVADSNADSAFANAEPPSHDDWSPETMRDQTEKTFVRVALRDIRSILTEYARPAAFGRGGDSSTPLAGFSDQLGGLFPAEQGPGARAPARATRATRATLQVDRGGAGGSTRSDGGFRASSPLADIRIVGDKRVVALQGQTALAIDFDLVVHGEGTLTADANVVLEGGAPETEPPVGSATPDVIEWTRSDGTVIASSRQVDVRPAMSGRWSVVVSLPTDSMVAVTVSVRAPATV